MATKLVEWLFGLSLFLGFWTILLTNINSYTFLANNSVVVTYLPLIALVLFGLYAVAVILWRVYTFNDCEEAAKEIMQQIDEAKEDLASKGFVFPEKANNS